MEVNLVIEVDGAYHNEQEQKSYDEGRSNFLNEIVGVDNLPSNLTAFKQ